MLSLPAVQFSPGCSHAAAAEKFPPWGELFSTSNTGARRAGHRSTSDASPEPAVLGPRRYMALGYCGGRCRVDSTQLWNNAGSLAQYMSLAMAFIGAWQLRPVCCAYKHLLPWRRSCPWDGPGDTARKPDRALSVVIANEEESCKQPARPEILLDGGGDVVLVQLLGGDLLVGWQGASTILCFFAQRAPRAHN